MVQTGVRSLRTCSWLQRLKQSTVKVGPEEALENMGSRGEAAVFWVSGQHLSVDKGSAKGVVRVHEGMGVSVCERACSRLRVPLGRSSGSGAGVCTVCMCFRVSEPCLSDEDADFVLSMRAPEMG